MKGIVELEKYEDDKGWHWKMVSGNNKIFGHSEEPFSSEQALEENMGLNSRAWYAYYQKLYGDDGK